MGVDSGRKPGVAFAPSESWPEKREVAPPHESACPALPQGSRAVSSKTRTS